MRMLLKGGRIYRNRSFIFRDIFIEDQIISEIGRDLEDEGAFILDLKGMRIVPGFFDVHTHGAAGVDVNAATAEDFEKICRFQASQGVTNWLASVLTDTEEQTLWCIGQYNRWKQAEHCGANLMGLHLEGPFLAAQYKGAMPEELLRKPDLKLVKKYQQAAGGDIRYMTVSPELEGMNALIPEIRDLGIVVAIGHSGADYETARKAIAGGAMAATHTGNAMRLLHQHEPAIWGAVLENDEIYCEIISDGRHLHPGTVRLILKTKGMDRVVAVTDSIMAAGLADGVYKLGVNDVVVKDKDARLVSNGNRAGSTLTASEALINLMDFTKKPLEDILPLLTENPAKLIGVYDRIGSIEEGKNADLVVLDDRYRVCRTIVGGRSVFEAESR